MKITLRRSKNYDTETELLRGCQRGEALAQRTLYERYAPQMLSICRRYLPDAEAEDALLQGFARIFDRIGTFREEGSLEGWLRRVIVNEALGTLRRRPSAPLPLTLEYADEMPEQAWPDHQLAADDLLRLLQRLPDGYRAVFNLYALEGYSHAEIAELLGISPGTSKSQLSRARAWLQQQLTLKKTAVIHEA